MKLSKPVVNARFDQMTELQRVAECFRYMVLCVEHWISPEGNLRAWVRRNLLLGVWLIIPAVLIMPSVGFILWQVDGWLSLLTGIFGRFVVLTLLILLAHAAIRTFAAYIKR